uniref:Uncharacterized protein n=1 Tax=Onchocerca volvulus TaxID=6282 RepID=A0A8R1Y2Q4_ONCVO
MTFAAFTIMTIQFSAKLASSEIPFITDRCLTVTIIILDLHSPNKSLMKNVQLCDDTVERKEVSLTDGMRGRYSAPPYPSALHRDRQPDGEMDGWMDGWTDERTAIAFTCLRMRSWCSV